MSLERAIVSKVGLTQRRPQLASGRLPKSTHIKPVEVQKDSLGLLLNFYREPALILSHIEFKQFDVSC